MLLAQATGSLVERWFDTEAGMLGMSLTLNIVLFLVCWYLFRLLIKQQTDKSVLLENSLREIKVVYEQVFESVMDSTKAITELSTIVREAHKL